MAGWLRLRPDERSLSDGNIDENTDTNTDTDTNQIQYKYKYKYNTTIIYECKNRAIAKYGRLVTASP